MDIETVLRSGGGCARRAELVRSGRDAAELTALVATGRVERVGRGLYALPDALGEVVAARRLSGAVTCVSLAAWAELPLLEPPKGAHVAVPGHRGTPRPGTVARGTVLHWDSSISARRTTTAAPLSRALVHTMQCLPFRECVAVIDAALNRRRVRIDDLHAERPRAGRLAFDRVLRAVDGRAQSMPETFMRLAVQGTRLDVEPQVQIAGIGFVDLLVEGVLIVEVDGFAYHSGRREYREDRRRDRTAHLAGLPVLRFAFEDAVHATAQCAREIELMVRRVLRGGTRPIVQRLGVRSV